MVLGPVGSGKVAEFAWLCRWQHAAAKVFVLLGFRPIVWFVSCPVCLDFFAFVDVLVGGFCPWAWPFN